MTCQLKFERFPYRDLNRLHFASNEINGAM
jgi:hypothetical protein